MYRPSPVNGPLRQGEILSQVVELRVDIGSLRLADQESLKIGEKVHPFALILTQDCDLDWDYSVRQQSNSEDSSVPAHKLLPNVLLCELWLASQLKGQHSLNSGLWKPIRKNRDERFHFLEKPQASCDLMKDGFPDDLTLDFKRVFTIDTEELYFRLETDTKRRCCLQGPFVQDISNRFAYYLSRVALPETAVEPI